MILLSWIPRFITWLIVALAHLLLPPCCSVTGLVKSTLSVSPRSTVAWWQCGG